MSASTANRNDLPTLGYSTALYPVLTNTHIYQGTHVCVTSAGYLVPAADTSGLRYVGIAMQEVNNTGSSGSVSCQVLPKHKIEAFEVYAVTPLVSWVGKIAVWSDDHTIQLTGASGANDVIAGKVIEIRVTGSSGKVAINPNDRTT